MVVTSVNTAINISRRVFIRFNYFNSFILFDVEEGSGTLDSEAPQRGNVICSSHRILVWCSCKSKQICYFPFRAELTHFHDFVQRLPMSSRTYHAGTGAYFSGCLIFVLALAVGVVIAIVKHSGEVGQRFSQQIYAADVIGRALLAYENNHHGATPSSLGALDINAAVASDESALTDRDLSQFHLMPPGTRTGTRPVDVVFETAEENSFPWWARFLNRFPDLTIRIYRDGETRSEFSKPDQRESDK